MSLNAKNKTKKHAPSGLLFSLWRITQVSIVVIVLGVAFYRGSYLVMAFVVAIFIVPAVKRIIRRKSQLPLSQQGDGSSDDYSVSNGMVHVKKGGIAWSKPLSDYEGVLRREETSNFRRQSRNYTRQIVELRHRKDRDYDVNIYTSLEDTGVRARWEEAAQTYNLPALRDLGDGKILRREPGDVGKSLQDLASEDGLDVSFDIDAPVPAGARWTHNGTVLEVDQRRAPWRCLLIASPILLFYGLVGYNLPYDVLFGADATLRPFYRVIIYTPAVLIAGIWVLIAFQIRVTPDEVVVIGRLGPIPLWRQALPLDEVEEILVDPSLIAWHTVLIESVSITLRVWPLSEASAQWLAQFLQSAIAFAPDPSDIGGGQSDTFTNRRR